jgi:alpha-1,3-rhamnosyl/mannosyltransferase
VRELLRALSERRDPHRYLLYARRRWDGTELDERFSWVTVAAGDPWWHVGTALRANRECDVFLSTNSYLTVWFLRIPAVPVVYDLVTFEPAMRPNRRSSVIERMTLPHAARRAALLLCISHATATALAQRYPRTATKTAVAPLGVAPALAAEGDPGELPALPPRFVLAVGTLEPRKNLPRLVEAYRRLPPAVQEAHPLVVVGALGWETGETLEALRSLGSRARALGHVSDGALAELYRRCTVFCYPSLGEGFGLPVLEAMAAGAAVITSNVSSLPEVGGDAVEYVDPTSVADMAASLQGLLESPARREELAARARTRAAGFSWGRTAELSLGALERAADARRARGPV